MALRNVSFDVKQGSVTSIIGPNGAGKTTLFNVVSGILSPDAGKVIYEGKDITGNPPYKICFMGITRTFQNLQVFENMSVLENVMVGYHARTSSEFISCMVHSFKASREEKEMREKAREVLNSLNLIGREDHLGSSLPFGDQKRLELARALVCHPKVILLDEPVAGLNISETEKMGDLILEQKESGITIVLVEHDMNLVMKISDMIVVLNYGEKIAEGPPREIRDSKDVAAAYLGNMDS